MLICIECAGITETKIYSDVSPEVFKLRISSFCSCRCKTRYIEQHEVELKR